MVVAVVIAVPAELPVAQLCIIAHAWIYSNAPDARQLLVELREHNWSRLPIVGAQALAQRNAPAPAPPEEELERKLGRDKSARQPAHTKPQHDRKAPRTQTCLLLTQNVRGLPKAAGETERWMASFRAKESGVQAAITLLQETHTTGRDGEDLERRYRAAWAFNKHAPAMSYWSAHPVRAAGVGILLNPYKVTKSEPQLLDLWTQHFMAITCDLDGQHTLVVNVYAPSDDDGREDFFSKLADYPLKHTGPVIIGGDFNCTNHPVLDRTYHGSATNHQSAQLRRWLRAWRLEDALARFFPSDEADHDALVKFQAAQHTYTYKVRGHRETSRLDRWYVSAGATEWIQAVNAIDLGRGSDHAAVALSMADPRYRVSVKARTKVYPPKAGAAAAIHALITRELSALLLIFDDLDARHEPPASYMHHWEAFKERLVAAMGVTAKEAIALINRSYKFKIARLRRLIRSPDRAKSAILDLEKQLSVVVTMWQGLKQRKHYATNLEAANARFTALVARTALPRAAQVITRLDKTPGAPPRDPTDYSNLMADGWTATFTQPERVASSMRLDNIDQPTLSPDESARLGELFTDTEVRASLARCKRSKSGGPDQLPNAFYRDYAEALEPILLRLYNKCYQAGTTPPSFQTATIVCLPKAGRTSDPLGYRPISLLNTDYKVYMRLLTTRLKPLLPKLITSSQGGFVPGRNIHDVIDLFMGAQTFSTMANTPTVAVLLDVRKAYDSLDRQYLQDCLKIRSFPPQFLQAIATTHTATTGRFCVNGTMSTPLAMTCGIRQGCPLAPMLFIIAMDPLYRMISGDEELREPLPELPGILPPCAGYADDTALYLENETKLPRVTNHLDEFAKLSGLHVNRSKSVVLTLNPNAPLISNTCGLKILAPGELCRYLGAQVGHRVSQAAVWSLTVYQIERRLAMARIKTTSVYQRARLAAAIILPKVLFVARHHWPSPQQIGLMDARIRNFIWSSLFQDTMPAGAGSVRWMNKDLADMPGGAGGLSSPNIALELVTMAAHVVAQWCYDPTGLRNAAAFLLGDEGAPVQVALFLSQQAPRPKIAATLWQSGREAIGWVHCSCHRHSVQALQINTEWRWQHDEYERDYEEFYRVAGQELANLRSPTDGVLAQDWVSHIAVTAKGSAILHGDGTQLRLGHLKPLGEGKCVSDIVTWRWKTRRTLRFKARRVPRTDAEALCFRMLCDTLVVNFPDLTRCPDEPGLVRTFNIRPTLDTEWIWGEGQVRRRVAGIPRETANAATQRDLQRQAPVLVDTKAVIPSFMCLPALTKLVRPWQGATAWYPKRRHYKRTLGRSLAKAGQEARAAREHKWRDEDDQIATALARVPWHSFVAQPGLSTYDTQLWTRLRHHQLRIWGSHDRRGKCARATCAAGAHASPAHIAWHCPRAQQLWLRIHRLWGASSCGPASVCTAVFARRPPDSAFDWRATLQGRATGISDRLEWWLRVAWAQLVSCGLNRLWAHGVQMALGATATDRLDDDYHSVIHHWTNRLRGNLQATLTGGADTKDTDTAILRGLIRMATKVEMPPRQHATQTKYLLFFDGGSRGNPGPGGSGSVIVRLGAEPTLQWAAAMAYGQSTTTNNQAEYQGLCHGLAAAERNQWTPLEVVGDSMMIIRQMTTRRRPKAPPLRPLYEQARSTADALRVRGWHHHYRAHNKMADKAANQAMDGGASFQAEAATGRQEFGELREWLSNDVSHWLDARAVPPGRES